MTSSLAPLLAGLGLGFSLIIAIGAQNVFVLRQGIRREHVLAVVLLCALSDAALIMLGISGIGTLLAQLPWLLPAARWAGAAFLVGYGLLAARRALRPGGVGLLAEAGAEDVGMADGSAGEQSLAAEAAGAGIRTAQKTGIGTGVARTSLGAALATAFALTWLNPHVYLDTVFLLGSVANGWGEAGRWLFGAGAVTASIIWFTALGFGARYLGRVLSTPRAWRILDGAIAVVMVLLGVLLVLPH